MMRSRLLSSAALAAALILASPGHAQVSADPASSFVTVAPEPAVPPSDATLPEAAPPEAPPPPTVDTVSLQPVEATTLAAPDAFSTAGRTTGLTSDLWRGASLSTMKTVLPMLASGTLSPAASQLARRVLATGAPGPQGAVAEPGLAGERALALMALGEVSSAAAILSRAPGLDRSSDLSRAAAESALLAGDDARACAVANALGVGRDEIYWLRLRAYCLAVAGQTSQAQLTFEIAQTQARDVVFARLMGAKLAGSGDPGPASLRNGLDYALSRSLGISLTGVAPAPAVAAALAGGDASGPSWSIAQNDLADITSPLAADTPPPPGALERLLTAAEDAEPKVAGPRLAGAILLLTALQPPADAELAGRAAALVGAEGKSPVARALAMEWAAQQRAAGQTALLALWTSAEAGIAGPTISDRARIVRALHLAGLEADARAFTLEGLLALK